MRKVIIIDIISVIIGTIIVGIFIKQWLLAAIIFSIVTALRELIIAYFKK